MAWNRLIVLLGFIFISSVATAQVNRYMVFFKDKAGTSYSTSAPKAFLSQRAVDRRIQQDIAITEQDFPVNAGYVQSVAATGASVFFPTRWMNGVLVQCDVSVLTAVQALSFVDHVEWVAPNARLANGRKKNNKAVKAQEAPAKTQAQLQLIGLDEMQEAGYKGENMLVAIFDGGFPGVNTATPFHHLIQENRIDLLASHDFVGNTDNVFQYDEHGTEVFSVIAANQDGVFTGGSYEANYQLYVTEDTDSEYRIEEYNWLFAAERADSAGVDIVNSSLGYYDFDDATMNYAKNAMDGKTTVISRAAQWAADRGMVIVCSAGNEGATAWQIITAPADAKDVLAVASVTSGGARSASSSIGPSADGRIKPDVAAMGVSTSIIRPDGTTSIATGTSLSAPLITSLAAGVWERYPKLSNKEVIDVIRKSASQAKNPDNLLGYGIPNFRAVVNYIEQMPQEDTFDVYPNPVNHDTLTIRPFDPNQVATCRLELLSAQGAVVFQGETTFSWLNRAYTVNLAPVSSGYYVLRVTWGDKRFTYKLIKI
ncbi:S8 family peptidase [Chryseolinea soli]|uniref:T9SS C-terminal target domain-containing protein n=1 Tax=Chryseolinea soli TaxID=2321403 RepID=A0A385SMA5_9BACT|nr:S8 family peptidase [Chryseolinea soli]AYB32903.1 T9SS C-terminal target domain-containing protein [Chryseolinea soli]